MKGRRILFVDESKKSRKQAVRILAATHAQIDCPESEDEARKLLEANNYDILFASAQNVSIFNFATKVASRATTILVAQAALQDTIQLLVEQNSIGNFIAKNSEGEINAQDLLTTTEKIFRSDIFGVDKYLKWGVDVQEYYVYDSSLRMRYTNEIVEYCRSLGCRDSLIGIVTDLCDELLMNAIYDAPRFETGEEKYNKLDRKETVRLSIKEGARLQYASDGDTLAIGVADPFGAITRKTIINYLHKCFGKGENQIESGDGGAGLGLYIIWKSVNQFIVNLDPGVKTEVIGLINLGMSMKEFKQVNRSFHFFTTGHGPVRGISS